MFPLLMVSAVDLKWRGPNKMLDKELCNKQTMDILL